MRHSKRGRLWCSHLTRTPSYHLSRIKVRDISKDHHFPGVSVVHVTLPPRYTHVPIVHRRTAEWLMVVKGSGTGVIGGRKMRLTPGKILFMPAGTPHQMGTMGEPIEVVVLFSPPLDGRRKNADIHPVGAHG